VNRVKYMTFDCRHTDYLLNPREIYVGYHIPGLAGWRGDVVVGLRVCSAECASREVRRVLGMDADDTAVPAHGAAA
jgi:hypothetical protein